MHSLTTQNEFQLISCPVCFLSLCLKKKKKKKNLFFFFVNMKQTPFKEINECRKLQR